MTGIDRSVMEIGGHILAFTGTATTPDVLPNALESLSGAGYRSVELMGLDVHPSVVEGAGLAVAACHGVPEHWQDLDRVVDRCRALRCHDICSSGPLRWNGRSAADYRATADRLNQVGRILRAAEIHLHYHNHGFEFEPIDGGLSGFELLTAELDPQACDFCLDLGWVARAGQDPLDLLQAQAEGIGLIHLRDFAGERSVPLGCGDVDLQPLLSAVAMLPRCRHVLVEQDQSSTPAEDMAASLTYLRGLGWA